ncbi:MAG: tRNA (adenosine(37)-N6)-dimethylallyltransferase MiaA, partial [Bacteroidetes bacterium]
FARIDRQNPARVLRALELYRATGQPASTFRQGRPPKVRPWQTLKVGLYDDRSVLYDRINRRVEAMMDAGLEAEVRTLVETYGPEAPGLQSIGYQEWLPYFAGERDRAEVVRLIQRNSRRYAKRQLTYYRHQAALQWFRAGDHEAVLNWLEAQGAG